MQLLQSLFNKRSSIILTAGLLFLSWLWSSCFAFSQDIIIVVHPDNPITNISLVDLTQIFLKKKTFFASGKKIEPVDFTPLKTDFYEHLLGKKLPQISHYWIRAIFSGKAIPPAEFKRISKLIVFLEDNEGGIAYLPSNVGTGRLKILNTAP